MLNDVLPSPPCHGISNCLYSNIASLGQFANWCAAGVHSPYRPNDIVGQFCSLTTLATAGAIAGYRVRDVFNLSSFAKVMRIYAFWIVTRMQNAKFSFAIVVNLPANYVSKSWSTISFLAHDLTISRFVQRTIPLPALISVTGGYISPESHGDWCVCNPVTSARLRTESATVAVALWHRVSSTTHLTQERNLAFFTITLASWGAKFPTTIFEPRGSNQKVLTAKAACSVRVIGNHNNSPYVTQAELNYTTAVCWHQLIVDQSEAYCVSA